MFQSYWCPLLKNSNNWIVLKLLLFSTWRSEACAPMLGSTSQWTDTLSPSPRFLGSFEFHHLQLLWCSHRKEGKQWWRFTAWTNSTRYFNFFRIILGNLLSSWCEGEFWGISSLECNPCQRSEVQHIALQVLSLYSMWVELIMRNVIPGFLQLLLLAQSWWRRSHSSAGKARAVVAAGWIWPVLISEAFQTTDLPAEAALVQVSQVTLTWPAWEKTLRAALSGNLHPTPGVWLILFR